MQKVIHIVDIQHGLLRKFRSKTLRTSKHEMKYALDKYISYHEHLSEHFSYQTDLKHTFIFLYFLLYILAWFFFFLNFSCAAFSLSCLSLLVWLKRLKMLNQQISLKG